MAQVDIQAGPFRVVSLMSREAVDELDLRVGSVAVAVIKSTTVVVERAAPAPAARTVGQMSARAVGTDERAGCRPGEHAGGRADEACQLSGGWTRRLSAR